MAKQRETLLCCAVAVLLCVSAALLATLLVLELANQNEATDSITNSNATGWQDIAAALGASIDLSIDPCSDFYQFACGNWIRINRIPPGRSRHDAFSMTRDRVAENMAAKLNETAPKDQSLPTALRKLKWTYDSCMDEQRAEALGSQPLLDELKSLSASGLLTWPPTNVDFVPIKLEEALATMKLHYGLETLISSRVFADDKNTSFNALHLDQAVLAFGAKSEVYYLKPEHDSVRRAYEELITVVLDQLLKDANYSISTEIDTRKIAQEILKFEIQISAFNSPAERRRDPLTMYHKVTTESLQRLAPAFKWTVYLRYLHPHVKSVDNYTIIAHELGYIESLGRLLEQYRTTGSSDLGNFLTWRYIFSTLRFLDSGYRAAMDNFISVLSGRSQTPRWQTCVNYVIGSADDAPEYLGYAAGYVFISSYFNGSAKEEIEHMVQNIVAQFRDNILPQATWMDEQTKKSAKEKIESLGRNTYVGYPKCFDDVRTLNEYYADLSIIQSDSFFRINQKILHWMISKQFKELLEPFEGTTFGGSPAIVNAWFSPPKNSITFPAGILQPPFFSAAFPKAVNYGAIGAVIGHEITHGFDDQGSQYDARGNVRNWWSNSSRSQFDKSRKCMVDQYSKFRYWINGKSVFVNGRNTQGENIADNGGIKESFLAYRSYVEVISTTCVGLSPWRIWFHKVYPITKEEPRLPGGLQHFSMDQVFFLGFASYYCGSKTDQAMQNQLLTNEHSPGRDRVNGALQNFDSFSRVFKCPIGANMNPTTKCTVW